MLRSALQHAMCAGRVEHALRLDPQILYKNYTILDDYFNNLSQFPWKHANSDQMYFGKCFGKNKWFITIGKVQTSDAKRVKHNDSEADDSEADDSFAVWQAFDDSPAYAALIDLSADEQIAADKRMDAACEQMGIPNFGLILDVNDADIGPDFVVLSYHMIPVQLSWVVPRKDLAVFPTAYLARGVVKN